ncbi:MAG: biopolymer transporter ExbD [Myxococcota bacterium]|nr:biopolymer transporter ExbD [Myxococcota bacterium]
MASISTDGGHGGKKTVDHEIPLVPFIDLLLCCIMFLLVTAVWNQLASLDANLDAPGHVDQPVEQSAATLLSVRVQHDGFVLFTDAGDETRVPLASDGAYDLDALAQHLAHRRALDPNQDAALISADDGVQYASVVDAMDALAGSGYPHVTITGRL